MRKLLISILLLFPLIGCNPERVEKVGQSLETTGNILELLAPIDRYLHQKVYDYDYKGEYQNGKRNGYGTLIWKDKESKGQKYVGYFKDNRMHGKGTMSWSNGDKYIGEFNNDKFDGEGTYFYNNGNQQGGIWKDGFFEYEKKLNTNTNTKKVDNYVPSYKAEYTNKSSCDPTISSWCKNETSKSSKIKVSNTVKVNEKKEVKEKKGELGFWGKTDKFLKQGANLISKKDKITGLRSLNTTSDKQAKKRGIQSLNWFVAEAKKQNAKVYKSGEPEYERVKYILDRVVQGSHYRNEPDVRFEVINSKMVNAYAFGGGNFLVFTGLMNKATDDELAFVIAHELAHNSASHNEEKAHYMRMKDVFGKKPTNVQRTIFSNIMEQEADRIGIVYTALAGFDPCASATYWKKQFQGVEQYAYFRTHPANPQRASANSQMCAVVKKYYTRGQVNPNVEKVLQCNELFCNKSGKELEAGKGGGVVAVIEVLADTIQKNKQAKEEQRKQEQEIAQAKKLLAQKRLLTPPNINWVSGWNLRYKGIINRHNQKSGVNFAFTQNFSQGQFYYNFNNKIEQGNIVFTGTNQHGYWFKWNDKYGQGNLQLREYTDGSLRGVIYIDDGTMLGKQLGDFIGYKK